MCFLSGVRGGEEKNRRAESSDKQLHGSLFGRQVGMSCGLPAGRTAAHSRDGTGRRETAVRQTVAPRRYFFFRYSNSRVVD